jgi:hypothetical protein
MITIASLDKLEGLGLGLELQMGQGWDVGALLNAVTHYAPYQVCQGYTDGRQTQS